MGERDEEGVLRYGWASVIWRVTNRGCFLHVCVCSVESRDNDGNFLQTVVHPEEAVSLSMSSLPTCCGGGVEQQAATRKSVTTSSPAVDEPAMKMTLRFLDFSLVFERR